MIQINVTCDLGLLCLSLVKFDLFLFFTETPRKSKVLYVAYMVSLLGRTGLKRSDGLYWTEGDEEMPYSYLKIFSKENNFKSKSELLGNNIKDS
jgi:hypothetical protein